MRDGRIKQILFKGLLALYDLCAVMAAATIAVLLRFEYVRHEFLLTHRASALVVLLTYLLVFIAFRFYQYRWAFAGVDAIWTVFLANVVSTILSVIWQVQFDGKRQPWSILIMTCILATAFIGGQRLILLLTSKHYARRRHVREKQYPDTERKRAVIMGEEHSVVDVLTALREERSAVMYEVIGILDPDPQHHGTYLRGIKILGGWDMIYDLVQRHVVDEVIIALHNGSSAKLREYMLACCRHKVGVRMVPVTAEWLENPSASRRQMRVEAIRVEDLLHRPSVAVTAESFRKNIAGQCVLVTGAGGSIGSELCRQIAKHQPASLLLLGHGENSIHQIQLELHRLYPDFGNRLVPVICDMRDGIRLNRVMEQYQPDMLFHAAAHKHVPLMEDNVAEAVINNVGGTRNVLRAAQAHGIRHLVLISTDKAVNPSSVMGATKFLCEEMARSRALHGPTAIVTVRFGNVLGSRGSVLPHFQEQILHGGPVTVTHPEMQRYFMTIPEAVSLVLCAGTQGQSGELFVLDMGRPVNIVNLAEDVIRLSGLVPYRDIQIDFTGLRPGEKLNEELFTEHEQRITHLNDRLFVVSRPQYIDPSHLDEIINGLLKLAVQHQDAPVMERLHQIIPTFRSLKSVSTPMASSL